MSRCASDVKRSFGFDFAFFAIWSSCVDILLLPPSVQGMFPWTSYSTCPAASPCTRLSRAPSTTSGSDFHRRFCLPQVGPFGWHTRPAISSRDGGGSPRCHDASISARAVLLDPAGVSRDHRPLRSLTVAFQVFDPVGLRMCHEAQSLHLRYGLDIALSTLNSCRHLHEPKTRFPVGRLVPFRGGNFTR